VVCSLPLSALGDSEDQNFKLQLDAVRKGDLYALNRIGHFNHAKVPQLMFKAIECGHAHILKELLMVAPQQHNLNLLHYACRIQKQQETALDMVKVILKWDHLADVNAQDA